MATQAQKHYAQLYTKVIKENLDLLEAGQDVHAQTLDERREKADRQLCFLLEELLCILPKDIRVGVQECFNLRQRVWSHEYFEAFYAPVFEQKEARSESLATANELELKPC